MFLKRKKLKSVEVGGFCSLSQETLRLMRSTDEHILNSASYIESIEGGLLNTRKLRSKRGSNNKVLVSDVELFYLSKNSQFNGVCEVVPLMVNNDSFNAIGLKTLINRQKKFLIRNSSLIYVSDDGANFLLRGSYGNSIRNYIKNSIISPKGYDISKFSWGGK